jgi:hypothetical protein
MQKTIQIAMNGLPLKESRQAQHDRNVLKYDQNVQVCDTTGDDSSNAAHPIKKLILITIAY